MEIIQLVFDALAIVGVIFYATERAKKHFGMISRGYWIGHSEDHEGREFIIISAVILLINPLLGAALVVIMGTWFNLYLNKLRDLPYNYLGVMEDGGGIGDEDARLDIFEYKYLYPYQVHIRVTAILILLLLYVYEKV